MQWQLSRTERWTPEQIAEYQFRQIRTLVGHAIEHCDFYRGHLAAAGVRHVHELTAEAYRRWPLLRKREVAERQAALTAARYPKEHGPATETFTTGSTGEPTRVLHTDVAKFFANLFVIRDHLWHARALDEKLVSIRFTASEGRQASWSPATAAAFRNGPAVVLDVQNDVGTLLDALLREEPSYLLAPPSILQALLHRSRETARVPRRLREVLTFSEALPPGLRDLVRRVWAVELSDAYSCREAGALALQCPGTEHYHVQAENVYVEILRHDGTPCTPGETGRVVITPLHNFAMPLLRYELGDFAEPGAPCLCGRGLPVIRRIAGRTRNMARDPSGRIFQPAFDPVLKHAPLRQFQVVQHSLQRLELRYVLDRELTAAEADALTAALIRQLGYPFEIGLTRVEEIDRAPGGKYEAFLSRLGDG